MKTSIHPELYNTKFICSCGHIVEALSTIKSWELRIEVCAACHPFYTGEQKLLKTWAVDKFYAKMAKVEAMKNANK